MRAEPSATDRRARQAVSTIFLINGLVLASWVPHIPYVKHRLGIGDGELGLVLLAMAVGAVCALSLTGALVRRYGSRSVTRLAAFALCLAVSLPVLGATLPSVVLSLFVLGACNGTLDVAMNAQAIAVERRYAHPIMSSFHGLFSAGGLLGAALTGGLAALGVAPAMHVVGTAIATCAGLGFVVGWLLDEPGDAAGGLVLARPVGRLRLLGVLAFGALLAEGAMADWSAVFLHDVLATSSAVAAAGFAACSLMMAVGRFAGDRVVAAYGPTTVLRASGAIGAVGLSLALLLGSPLAAVAGFGLVGLGIANAIPILFSRAGNLPGIEPGVGIAAVATLGYLGFLAGPPIIGVVAELATLRLALGLVVLCCGLLALRAGAVAPVNEPDDAADAARLAAG